jgi:hypothetical protein
MCKENSFCKKFVLSADWDRAVAALPKKDENLTSADLANRAYARCFQLTENHKDGSYDDAVADASKALVKDCRDRNLCIRAYVYYLNNNYEAAIADCERVIELADCVVDAAKQEMKRLWEEADKAEEEACKKIREADKAEEEADKAEKVAEVAEKANSSDKDDLKTTANAARTAADTARTTANAARTAANTATQDAADAQEAYCAALRPTAFAHELLGLIYTSMGLRLEASKHYKLALLARQTDIVPASPLLMDAYRNACASVKSV